MSRSGYYNFCDEIDLNILHKNWRGAVLSAIRGRRGQHFLRELLKTLDNLPEKRLIAGDFQNPDGQVCTLGAYARYKNIDISHLDPEDYQHHEELSNEFNIAEALVQEIEHLNDEYHYSSPEDRWQRMRSWVARQLDD